MQFLQKLKKVEEDINFSTTNKRTRYLVVFRMVFRKNVLAIELKKLNLKINKPVYLGLLILEISKKLNYDFCDDYIKPKYKYNAKLCYIETDSSLMYIQTKDVYKEIETDIEERFNTSNYEINRSLSKGKNKEVIVLMKDELEGKIMAEFVGHRPKTYSYLIDDGTEDKKAKIMKNK